MTFRNDSGIRGLWAVCLFTLCGCNHGIPGSGVVKDEAREVAEFTGVALAGIGKVEITVGQPKSVTVSVDDNLLEYVETKVDNGILKINTSQSIAPRAGLMLTITTPSLSSAMVSGVGNISVHDATGDELSITVSGVGDIVADGTVKSLEVRLSGVGGANLTDLKADHVKVTVTGTGSAEVFASESVDAQVSGVGSIELHGNPPNVKKSASGIGKVTIRQ